MSLCWPLQGMSGPQKAVLISLADNANDEGVCWPSVARIAERTCLGERTVQSAIKWLGTTGILSFRERMGRSTMYTLTPAAYAPPQQMHPAADAPPPPPDKKPPPPTPPPPPPQKPTNYTTPTPLDAHQLQPPKPQRPPPPTRQPSHATPPPLPRLALITNSSAATPQP
ncbi:helix-turn-helix domain-containing protein, partial [Pseudomonas carnis]|nr:helix-turn-helix domain-containing protein [Pseudomonas carnis]